MSDSFDGHLMENEAGRYAQLLLDSTSEGVYGIDRAGRCAFINRAGAEMLGWSAAELLGKDMHALIHHHHADGRAYAVEECPILKSMGGAQGCRVKDEVFWRRDGSSFFAEYSSNPLLENGQAVGAVITFLDITGRRDDEEALRQSEARKGAIMASALDAILTIDARGFITDFNAAAERIFQCRRAEAIGREMAELIIPPRFREMHRRGLAHYVATGEGPILDQRIEINAQRADGTEFPVELTVTRIPMEGALFFTGFVRDLTDRKAAEEVLRAAQEEQRSMIEAIPQQVWTARPDGGLNYVNQRVIEYFGRNVMEMIDWGWQQVVHPVDLPASAERWKRALATGEPYETEFRLRRADGAYRWHLGRALPMKNALGEVLKWFGTNTDITDRKLAEQQREAAAQSWAFLAEASVLFSSSLDYETTLDHVAQLAVPQLADWCSVDLLEPGGEIRSVTLAHHDAARRALALRLRREFPPRLGDGSGVAVALESGKAQIFSEIEESHLERIARNPEHLALLRSMPLRSAMIVPMALRDTIVGCITFVTETDDFFNADDLVLAQNLASRAALCIQNARLYSEAREANRAKDNFLAVLSHELRTPLNPVLMAVSAMETDPNLPAPVRADIAMIRRNVELEARLIDDLLDLTRIANGKVFLRREIVEVQELFAHAANIVRSDTALHQPPIETDFAATELHAEADPARLQQIFWNLIKNAVKFTAPTGRVILRSSNPAPGQLRLEIIDTGRGIDAALLPRIFDAFQQEQITGGGNPYGGLGLGLAISKALAELQNATLTAASPGRGQGATFTLTLPTAPAGTQSPVRPETGGAAFRGLRILLVEDHETTGALMVRLLERRGHRLHLALTKAAALAAAATDTFDLVISDLGLPDGSGFDLMRELRDRHQLNGIALSGYGTELDHQRSRESGFHEHLTKPVDMPRLDAAIAQAAAISK